METESGNKAYELSKSGPSDVFPVARSHQLNLCKQCHQLGTKCSNTWSQWRMLIQISTRSDIYIIGEQPHGGELQRRSQESQNVEEPQSVMESMLRSEIERKMKGYAFLKKSGRTYEAVCMWHGKVLCQGKVSLDRKIHDLIKELIILPISSA